MIFLSVFSAVDINPLEGCLASRTSQLSQLRLPAYFARYRIARVRSFVANRLKYKSNRLQTHSRQNSTFMINRLVIDISKTFEFGAKFGENLEIQKHFCISHPEMLKITNYAPFSLKLLLFFNSEKR